MRLSPFALVDRWLSPAPDPRKVAWIAGTTFAHRGLHGGAVPENSPIAFADAILRGFGIECDIQRSADGQAMVFHDWELDRMTAETGPVVRRTAAQLSDIRLAGTSSRMISLHGLLEQVSGQVPLLIEVKSKKDMHIAPVCLAVLRALEGYRGPHAVMSFDPRISRWFSKHSPSTVRGLVVTEDGARALPGKIRRRLAFWHGRPDFLAWDIRDLPSGLPAAQRRRGLPVTTWTVRTPELAARAALHADAPIAEGAGIGEGAGVA